MSHRTTVREQARTIRPLAGAARVVLAVVVAWMPLIAPVSALATRLGSDRVADAPLSSGKVARSKAPDLNVRSGILVTANGQVLWSRDAQDKRAMASITKVMTALLVLEQCGLDDVARVPKEATLVDSASGLHTNEKLTVRKLLELTLIASSNDAAATLAVHTGGSMPKFVEMMNARAKELGLTHTHFKNPHGLDEKGHYSCATDLAKLLRTAMQSPEFQRIVKMKSVKLPAYNGRSAATLAATDDLLGDYKGLLGGKTGFTDDAGYSFAASAERDGVMLTCVVLGTSSNSERFGQSSRLLNWGFSHMRPRTLSNSALPAGVVTLTANPSRTVALRYAESTTVPVFDLAGDVTTKTTLVPRVQLPVFPGQPLGEAVFLQNGQPLTRVPVVAAESVASAEETVGCVPVADYLDRAVTVRVAASKATIPEYDTAKPVQRHVELDARVIAPVTAGQRLGKVVYSQRGKVLVSVPVVAAEAVEEPTLASRVGTWFARGWLRVTGRPTMAQRTVLGA